MAFGKREVVVITQPKFRTAVFKLTKEMLEDALHELIGFRKKYEMLKEFASVFKAIDKLPLIKKMKK